MTLLQKIWSVLGAVLMTALALVGMAGWIAERRKSRELADSAAALARQNAERARAQAAANATAVDAESKGRQDAAANAGAAGLAERITKRL